ncbi:MAG: sulfide/dihydroorotate dehydrogenase-like FAD/NAD-binding protein [Candidatus Omnitrophica bacterium]|nr:sulfide/dihydroorotate dehydrogenase-like FAD/NAD-binding protein [Candidatus Omnitrophota bacterium]MDD5042525.1 sulfide/dihydroorotate dehydrogenase-like FAD/NAD-binding protein [Candidatus Omnitrophota bacterium]
MRVVSKKVLVGSPAARIVRISLFAPEISKTAKAGQFVVVMAEEKGERVPLTIVDADAKAGEITLIFQEAGLTTRILGSLSPGDNLHALLGPLGHATQIKKYGKVILVGGGVGAAEIMPVARAMKDEGNHVTSILGFRNKELVILEEELRNSSDKVYVLTDDGSYGDKGFTVDRLKKLLDEGKYDLIYAVGPVPMMKNVSLLSREYDIRTIVSLNALMVDGTGMCGCCRVSVFGRVKFSCVDGPDFDAAGVDWEELENRNKVYNPQEKHACKLFREGKG